VDGNAKRHGTEAVSAAYLSYLYSPVAQELAAKHYYRPSLPGLANEEDLKRFPNVKTFTIDEEFGGWDAAQKKHFNDGGVFDQIYSVQ
jgi:sulfate transport system substrate-binding protein